MKKIQILLSLAVFFFINKAHSKDVYVKLELPIYAKHGDLDKAKHKQYIKKITNAYGFGLGYNFSDYVEAEVIFDQMKYSLYGSIAHISGPQRISAMPFVEQNSQQSQPQTNRYTNRFSFAEIRNQKGQVANHWDHSWGNMAETLGKNSGKITGHCNNIPTTLLTNKEVCSENLKPNRLLAFARLIEYNGIDHGLCNNIPHTFFTKAEICSNVDSNLNPNPNPNPNANSSPGPSPNTGDRSVINITEEVIVQMKINALIASVKLKAPNKSIFTPFVSLGVGVSHMRIHEDKISGSKLTQTSKNKTSFAYRVGVGAKVKIYSRIGLEVTARYFDYGKYQLSENFSKKITGRDLSAAVIIDLS